MPLTAAQLFRSAQLTPDHFGNLIDFEGTTEEEQEAAMIAYVEDNVLAGASSEISVPVRTSLDDFTSPLDNAGLMVFFGPVSGAEVISLWNLAQVSYGRSELNKLVASNDPSYDKDSDQDRIQGNDRLKKLIAFIERFLKSNSTGGSTEPDYSTFIPTSTSTRINSRM